ncbi:MAG TPA: phage tail tube protein [Candidatus Paceibacterota bacterium]|nr:phage tail tube protein [Candidatus Paceibacterota bacterium]
MAQTTGIMNGTDLSVYFNATDGSETVIAHATECSISISEDARDTTTKQSSGWRELLEGLRSWSVSTSHLFAEDASNGLQEIWSELNNRAEVSLLFTNENTGDYRWNGRARIASIEKNAGTEDNVTYSVTFEGTGALVYEEVS